MVLHVTVVLTWCCRSLVVLDMVLQVTVVLDMVLQVTVVLDMVLQVTVSLIATCTLLTTSTTSIDIQPSACPHHVCRLRAPHIYIAAL